MNTGAARKDIRTLQREGIFFRRKKMTIPHSIDSFRRLFLSCFSPTSNIHSAPHAQLQRAFYNEFSFHRPHCYSRHYSAWYCVKWRKFMSIIVWFEKVINNQSGWPLALVTQTEEGEEVKGLSLRRRESLPFVRLLRRSLLPRPRPHCAG